MTHEEAKQKINEAAKILKSVVEKIENSPAETQNHYGRYMAILSQTPLNQRKIMAATLIKAGANRMGVLTALSFV